MSKRQVNEPFLMTPFSLLKTPEYLRYFDGAPVGAIYRLLRTGIRRRGVESLKFKSVGYITRLSELYDAGWLASHFTVEELAEASGFSTRSITTYINQLVSLKLVRIEKRKDGGQVFLLGKRLGYESTQGLSVGDNHEGFFIDAWESWLDKDEVEFRRFLVESLAPPKQKKAALGKILPTPRKNFSENEAVDNSDYPRDERDEVVVDGGPRIDKVRIDTKESESAADAALRIKYLKEIREAPNYDEALIAGRDALVNQSLTLTEVNHALRTAHVPDAAFPSYPRFSNALSRYEPEEGKEHMALAWLWSALHEDATGVASNQNKSFYTTVVGAYKNSLLKDFTHEQCYWTLVHIVRNGGSDLEFLLKGGRNLLILVPQHARKYHDLLEAKRLADIKTQASLQRAAEADEVDTEGGLWDDVENDPWLKQMKERVDKRREDREKLAAIRENDGWRFDVNTNTFVATDGSGRTLLSQEEDAELEGN